MTQDKAQQSIEPEKEIYAQPQEDGTVGYYSNKVVLVGEGKIMFQVGGRCVVRTIEQWLEIGWGDRLEAHVRRMLVKIERDRWITKSQQEVLNVLENTPKANLTYLTRETRKGNGSVQKSLQKLISVGLVTREGNDYRVLGDPEVTG